MEKRSQCYVKQWSWDPSLHDQFIRSDSLILSSWGSHPSVCVCVWPLGSAWKSHCWLTQFLCVWTVDVFSSQNLWLSILALFKLMIMPDYDSAWLQYNTRVGSVAVEQKQICLQQIMSRWPLYKLGFLRSIVLLIKIKS